LIDFKYTKEGLGGFIDTRFFVDIAILDDLFGIINHRLNRVIHPYGVQ
jgi:hypothetical protein